MKPPGPPPRGPTDIKQALVNMQRELSASRPVAEPKSHVGGMGEGDWSNYQSPANVLQQIAARVRYRRDIQPHALQISAPIAHGTSPSPAERSQGAPAHLGSSRPPPAPVHLSATSACV